MQLIDRQTSLGKLPQPHSSAVLHHTHWKQLVTALSQIDVKRLIDNEHVTVTKAWNLTDSMPSMQFWNDIDEQQPEAMRVFTELHKQFHLMTYVKHYAVVKDGKTVPSLLRELADITRRQSATPDPKVVAILAMTEYGGIGKDNGLPWGRIKGDLKRFKDLTLGNVVIQGFNTYVSIGKPLPDRINIVITSRDGPAPDTEWPAEVHVVSSVQAALDLAKSFETEWIYVIGGAKIYEAMLPHCSRIELTVVAGEQPCDTFVKFENGVKDWRFQMLESVKHDDGNLSHVYYQLVR